MRPRVVVAPRNAFFIVLTLAFVSLACWSFANPLVAAPDEQAHLIRAYALDHGIFGTPTSPPSKVNVDVTVPMSIYYSAIYPICWHQNKNVAATCSAAWPTSSAPETIPIYVDHYPPLYYLVVGTATYVSHERSGIYLMRLISAFMSSFMLGLAAYAIARWSRRRSLFMAMYVALAPEAYFLSSSITPSGFEITTAVCLWTLVAIFALEHRLDPPRELVALLAAVASVLVLIRGLSPLWVVLAGLVLVFLAGPRQLVAQWRSRRDLQIASGTVTLAALLAATWIFTQGTLNILPVGAPIAKSASFASVVRFVASFIQGWLREMVGILGWLDTELPGYVYQSWYTIVIGVLVIALWRGNWREKTVVLGLSALVVLIPLALVVRQAKVLGAVWQGRDTMPLAVGALILAAAICGGPLRRRERPVVERWGISVRERTGKATMVAVVVALAFANLLAFYTNLRRYAVGRYGPKFFFLHHQGWSPPTGQVVTLLVYAMVTLAFAGVVATWIWFTPRAGDSPTDAERIR